MLIVYPRHLKSCAEKLHRRGLTPREMRVWRRCGCPLWVIGTDPRGTYYRQSLNTTNWTTAEEQKRKIEAAIEETPRVEVASALENWKSALLAAKRGERTVAQVHGAMAKSLAAWCAHAGLRFLDELTLPVLDEFVRSWRLASTTHRGRIDLMRSFFRFAKNRKWIIENPAAGLIKPAEELEPTLPFTAEEERRIFEATEHFHERRNFGGLWARNPETARALLYVLRWTGLRISDAVVFEPHAIETVSVDGTDVAVYKTYQTKTGEWVMCPIPPTAALIIQSAPRLSGERAFVPAAGAGYKSDPRAVSNSFYANYLCPLSRTSGVAGIHAHRFRDTFAVRLLEEGKPLEIVQALLGHRSIKTTEKHYAPWVKSRQQMLVRELMTTW